MHSCMITNLNNQVGEESALVLQYVTTKTATNSISNNNTGATARKTGCNYNTTMSHQQLVSTHEQTDDDGNNTNNLANWSVVTGQTPASLSQHWSTQRERVGVIAFYQAREGIPWREFSNWYCKSGHGFDFALPQQLLAIAGINKPTDLAKFDAVVHCETSEKAIMLCKAAVMGDAASYARIKASKMPKEAKILGRSVAPWDEERWQTVVCGIAHCVLWQKFTAVPALADILLSTGNSVLAEATAGDKTWAIGISMEMPKIYEVPARWKGSNVLGWALMQVRSDLRNERLQGGGDEARFH